MPLYTKGQDFCCAYAGTISNSCICQYYFCRALPKSALQEPGPAPAPKNRHEPGCQGVVPCLRKTAATELQTRKRHGCLRAQGVEGERSEGLGQGSGLRAKGSRVSGSGAPLSFCRNMPSANLTCIQEGLRFENAFKIPDPQHWNCFRQRSGRAIKDSLTSRLKTPGFRWYGLEYIMAQDRLHSVGCRISSA